jgi:twitching motility protein PilT
LYVTRQVSADECTRTSGDPNEFLRMIGKGPTDDVLSGGTPQQRSGDRLVAGGTRR